ncbi:MAG: tRNA (N(6)-L-threonylcarbamoyladenosine(37)-C(2))-methylthiotransferase MtaB [Clostridia bacterium]|nr:tRNA (N(6)-L-threonylcarbamoyladenosine(37)-C(2))-methylthiotransferase MtaB [Clostridia bacterium]
MNKKAGFLTLGCKVNQYESAAIAERLSSLGFEIADFEDICDYYIINTCTVTSEADRKSRQMIRRAVKNNPNARVIVAGCYAQINADALASIPGVDVVLGSRTKMRVVDKILELEAGKNGGIDVATLCNAGFEKMMLDGSFGGGTEERTRAYVKIEDGCDSHCTYCIIPKARGSVSSKPPSDVLEEVGNLVNKGYLEVVLTGIETGAYGKDFSDGYTLADLLEEVDKIPGLERIRLGSLDPSIMKPDFVKRISRLKKLTPHFHLSLQSGCDRILALMKRKYNTKMLLEYMDNIRANIPDVMFTTDIICGFPGETDADFEDTCEFVKRASFLSAHIFAYSKREGTPAAVMPDQVPGDIASARVNKLYAIVDEVSREMLKAYDAREMTVIPEDHKNGIAHGHTASFIEIDIPCDEKTYEQIHGKIVPVRLAVNDRGVVGEILLQNNYT